MENTKEVKFKDFERELFSEMTKVARGIMSEYLENLDSKIKKTRDKKQYVAVQINKTSIKTVFGEVEYKRRYYKTPDGEYTYLLDEYLGFYGDYGKFSENLAEIIVTECAEKSFRKAAESVSRLTGQSITQQGCWNVVQQYGEKLKKKQAELKDLADNECTGLLGGISTPVIFSEYDDVWISRQKESRAKIEDSLKTDSENSVPAKKKAQENR